ncbi:GAF domain-containing protein [Amycolatopsis taiwanensis]|uniref:Histidine kinase n=1 Tax=Amycolatopsis taiwanensis TaxID=342230 RepID=A0A9W6QZV6_9PSEU|nr:GAF domain-containing protein [Amycolatopsis taiwanensis]GLY65880.1 histidine kinase [Amycolatopsis taiwanensis]
MTEPMDDRLLTAPVDTELAQRMTRLRALGLDGHQPVQEFDEFAAKVAQITKTPYAMVNFVGDRGQYLSGLYTPTSSQTSAALQAAVQPELSREWTPEYGFCPHVVVRRKALVLDDVCDYPRFAGNPFVDQMGVRSYMGAPLIDRTGTTLGTVCVVDAEPRPWGRPGLSTIKTLAAELMELINRREQ